MVHSLRRRRCMAEREEKRRETQRWIGQGGGVCLVMGQAGHFWLRLYSSSPPGRGRAGVIKWPACADASREGTRPARCAGVGSDARVCVPNATPASEGGSWSESVGSCDILYACMGCAVERELCSPPLGGQTGYAARRSAVGGRRSVLARGEMSGAAGARG